MSYSHTHLCAALEILAAYLSVVVEQGQKNRPLTQDEYTDAWHRGVHELRVSLAVASRESGKWGPVKQ